MERQATAIDSPDTKLRNYLEILKSGGELNGLYFELQVSPPQAQVLQQETKGWHQHHWKMLSGRIRCKPCNRTQTSPHQVPV